MKQVEASCEDLRVALNQLAKQIGPIQIGTAEQFPDKWGNAAMRTAAEKRAAKSRKANAKKRAASGGKR